jgi:DNA invertase Pin-like site-specific DNA recombinase
MRRTFRQPTLVGKHYGYARVSTLDQAQGISLEAQAEKIRAYGFATGRPIDHVYVDEALSGKNMTRPSLTALLGEVERGAVESIIVVKIDRLTRSIRDLCTIVEKLSRHGASLISTAESIDTGTASGRMVLHLLGILAQFEREQISERTSLSLSHLRRNKRAYGPTPFGYRRAGNQLVADPDRLPILREMHRQREAGASYGLIAQWLQVEGIAPNRGGLIWYSSAVREILLGPMLQQTLEELG